MERVEPADVEAALEARRELGREYEPEVIEAFLEKVERRIEERLREQPRRIERARHSASLPIVSLVFAIPLTAIAGGIAHLSGIVVVWVAIVLVNLAHAIGTATRR